MHTIITSYSMYSLEYLPWFSAGNKRFFNSRWSQYGSRGATRYDKELVYSNLVFFVSSEKFDYKSKRLYTIRRHNLTTNETITIGEFQQYNNRATANKYAEKYAKESI